MRAFHYSGPIPCAASHQALRGSPSPELRDMDVDIFSSATSKRSALLSVQNHPTITCFVMVGVNKVIKSQSLPP